jgi:hypothetical protein
MLRAGDVLENPVTGERAVIRVGTAESSGELLVADLYVRPGGAVMGEHLHPGIEESFTVVRGCLGYRLDGREGVAGPKERLHVPSGTVHDWWKERRRRGSAGPRRDQLRQQVRGDDQELLRARPGWQDEREGATTPPPGRALRPRVRRRYPLHEAPAPASAAPFRDAGTGGQATGLQGQLPPVPHTSAIGGGRGAAGARLGRVIVIDRPTRGGRPEDEGTHRANQVGRSRTEKG